jgi:hypothetical protein
MHHAFDSGEDGGGLGELFGSMSVISTRTSATFAMLSRSREPLLIFDFWILKR